MQSKARRSRPELGVHLNIIHILALGTAFTESQRVAFQNPIPKGLRLKAQGCEERATLGKCAEESSTPTGLRHRAMAGDNHLSGQQLLPFGSASEVRGLFQHLFELAAALRSLLGGIKSIRQS